MWDFFRHLFDTTDFPARWHCGNWSPPHGWLHIGSDIAIFLAYMALPVAMLATLYKRKDFRFPKTVWLFGAFIFFCGTTHLVESLIFWNPMYRLSGLLKLCTAVVSWATVAALIPTVRTAITLRSPEQLENEVQNRTLEIENQNTTLETMVHNIKSGVVLADANGDVKLYNAAANKLFGLDENQGKFDGSKIESTVFRKDKKTNYTRKMLPVVRAATVGETVSDERLLIRDNTKNSFMSLLVSAKPIMVGNKRTGAVASYVDMTDVLNTNAELSRSNKSLEQFAYIVSHDLTEPLRQVCHFSALLEEDHGKEMTEEGKSYVQAMAGSAKRMRALVDGLLSYSRLTGTGVTANNLQCNIARILDGIKEDLALKIKEKNTTVVTEGEFPTIYADEEKMRQVFLNLISNALKFSDKKKNTITVKVIKKEEHYQFEVKDEGIGIDSRFHEQIFLVFKRLHTSEEYKGTGIGLAICKRIVENFGGEIWVTSEPGQGTSFFFTIPS